jgi:glycosyltransferase involved in cell wall biosynthesis
MAELIDDGETGFLFEPGNHLDLGEKIRIVLDHSTELSEMGRTARKKAEREFNPLLHIEKITELYQHLV